MKIQSKKGAVILLISSLAFLMTVFLLANYQLKAEFLGQKQADLLDIASKGENALLYIDQMAEISLAETWKSKYGRQQPYIFSESCQESITVFNACSSDFKKAFESIFVKNMIVFNEIYKQDLKYKYFNIDVTPYGIKDSFEGLDVKGTATEKIIIKQDGIKYGITPNFHIRLSIEELDLLG